MKLHERIKPIRSEADYREAIALIDELIDAKPGSEEDRFLDVVTELVRAYEERNVEIPAPSPIAAIKFRMDQMGLSRRDLEPFIGSSGKVSEILNGKLPLTLKMIRSLHKNLRIPAEILLGDPNAGLTEDALVDDADRYPVKEMADKHWLDGFGSVSGRAEEAIRWLASQARVEPRPLLAHCRKNDGARTNAKMDPFAFHAWCLKVLVEARNLPAEPYDPQALDLDALRQVATLSVLPDGPLRAREFLAQLGIRLVVVEHLKQTYLDGAAMMAADGSPIVALTLRYKRLDNFWHSLLHELAHVHFDLTEGDEVFSDDFSVSAANSSVERRADQVAANALVPKGLLPLGNGLEEVAIGDLGFLARRARVHPAIIAGHIQHETGNWKKFARFVNQYRVDGKLEQEPLCNA